MLAHLSETRRINKELPVPFYYQIVGILRDLILDSEVSSPGGNEIPFPSEAELSEYFDVHRGTIRHALDILVREGLIYRERGRGTFVRRRRVEQDISTLLSTTEDLEQRGWTTSTRVLGVSSGLPRLHTQHALSLREGSKVWQLLRLRLANGEPIGVQRTYIPVDLAPDLDQHDLTQPLTRIMEQQYGEVFKRAVQTIRARRATSSEAAILEIEEGDPLIVISGVTWDQYGRPLEDLDSYWRYDRYDLRVSHTRE